MPTKGSGVVAVVVVVVRVGVGVVLVGVVLVGVVLVGVVLVGVVVFNGSDAAASIGTMVWLLCGTEMPITALAVKWVLFVA
jgi:hypothetical protein